MEIEMQNPIHASGNNDEREAAPAVPVAVSSWWFKTPETNPEEKSEAELELGGGGDVPSSTASSGNAAGADQRKWHHKAKGVHLKRLASKTLPWPWSPPSSKTISCKSWSPC